MKLEFLKIKINEINNKILINKVIIFCLNYFLHSLKLIFKEKTFYWKRSKATKRWILVSWFIIGRENSLFLLEKLVYRVTHNGCNFRDDCTEFNLCFLTFMLCFLTFMLCFLTFMLFSPYIYALFPYIYAFFPYIFGSLQL